MGAAPGETGAISQHFGGDRAVCQAPAEFSGGLAGFALGGSQDGMKFFEAGGGSRAITAVLEVALAGLETRSEAAVAEEGIKAIPGSQAGAAGGAVDDEENAPRPVAGGFSVGWDAGIEEPETKLARIGIRVEAAETDMDADLRQGLLEGFDGLVDEEPVGRGKTGVHVHNAFEGRRDPRELLNAGPAIVTAVRAGGRGILQGNMASWTSDRRRVEDRGRQQRKVHDEGSGEAERCMLFQVGETGKSGAFSQNGGQKTSSISPMGPIGLI